MVTQIRQEAGRYFQKCDKTFKYFDSKLLREQISLLTSIVLLFQAWRVSSAAERSSPLSWQWSSSPPQLSTPQPTTDRCSAFTRRSDWYRTSKTELWLFSSCAVWLVCLGAQHALHHETPATHRQRYRHHGDDHGHPSRRQPVLCANGHHMASGSGSTWRCECLARLTQNTFPIVYSTRRKCKKKKKKFLFLAASWLFCRFLWVSTRSSTSRRGGLWRWLTASERSWRRSRSKSWTRTQDWTCSTFSSCPAALKTASPFRGIHLRPPAGPFDELQSVPSLYMEKTFISEKKLKKHLWR